MMLFNTLFILAVAGLGESSPFEKRQGSGLFGSFANSFKAKAPTSVKSVTPILNKAATRHIIRYGPYTLGAANSTRSGFHLDKQGDSINGMVDGLCRDCMLLSGSTYLTYDDGTVADVATGVYNHHVFVANTGKSSKMFFNCNFTGGVPAFPSFPKGKAPGGMSMSGMSMGGAKSPGRKERRQMPGMSQIFGSGDDGVPMQYSNKDSTNKVGYYIPPNTNIFQSSEFINYRNESQVVYITFDVEFIQGRPPGWRDGASAALSASGCMNFMFFPPEGQVTKMKYPYVATASGSIYNAHAHLHDGGVNVTLSVNGKPACTSTAVYGGAKGTTTVGGEKWETIQNYEFCDGPIDVVKGDQILLESTYDLVKHKLRPGAMDHSMGADAMALLGFIFAENV